MAQDTQPEYQLDARGKIENFDESDWFIPQELPFKVKHNVSAGMAASKPHPWKRLRQLIAAENYQELPADVPTYVNMEAPPSMYPPKSYCDVTGCEAPYVDPKTHLRYANTEAFRIARSLTPDEVQARLAIRNAQYVLNTAISDYPDLIGDTTVILAKDKVVPEVVDNVTDKAAFKVCYGDRMVLPGDKLSINDIADEPKVEITQCNAGAVYSLLMLDPDMPSPHKPEYKDVLIWMVNNIKTKDFDSGDFTVEYSGPEPGRGEHRYVVLLFQQPSFQTITPPAKRAHFQTKQWAKDHQWGDPVAAVYFKAKHGDA